MPRTCRGAIIAGILVLVGSSGAVAAPPSAITNDLVATATAAAQALTISDDIALAQSGSRRIRGLAQSDHALQASTLDAFATWAQELRRAEAAEASAPTIDHLGPLIYQFNGAFRADVPGARLTGAESERLAQLRTLRGADFDAAFLAMHEAALRRLLDLYTDYIRNGDDQTLRGLSVRQKPRVQSALARLERG